MTNNRLIKTLDLDNEFDDESDASFSLAQLPLEATEEERLREMVAAQIGENPKDPQGTVTIMKLDPDSGKFGWVHKMSATEFENKSLPFISKTFGPGEYEIIVYGANKKIASRHRTSISEASRILQEHAAAETSPQISALLQAQEKTMEILALLAQHMAAPATVPASPAQSRAEFFQELKLMRELFPPAAPQASIDPFQMITKMAEIMKDLNPGEGEPTLIDQVSKFADKFGPTIEAAIKANSNPAPALLPGTPPGAVPGSIQKPSEDNAQMFQATMIRFYLNMLVDSAEKDEDAELYAEMIINKVPVDTLREWIGKPSLARELSKYNAKVLDYPEWFEKLNILIAEIVAEIDAEEKAAIEQEEKEAAEKAASKNAVPAIEAAPVVIPAKDAPAVPDKK